MHNLILKKCLFLPQGSTVFCMFKLSYVEEIKYIYLSVHPQNVFFRRYGVQNSTQKHRLILISMELNIYISLQYVGGCLIVQSAPLMRTIPIDVPLYLPEVFGPEAGFNKIRRNINNID